MRWIFWNSVDFHLNFVFVCETFNRCHCQSPASFESLAFVWNRRRRKNKYFAPIIGRNVSDYTGIKYNMSTTQYQQIYYRQYITSITKKKWISHRVFEMRCVTKYWYIFYQLVVMKCVYSNMLYYVRSLGEITFGLFVVVCFFYFALIFFFHSALSRYCFFVFILLLVLLPSVLLLLPACLPAWLYLLACAFFFLYIALLAFRLCCIHSSV